MNSNMRTHSREQDIKSKKKKQETQNQNAIVYTNDNQNENGDTGCPALAENNLLSADSENIKQASIADYQLANTKAKAWKKDASLVALSVKIPVNLDSENLEETFVFSSSKTKITILQFLFHKKLVILFVF